MRIPRYAYFLVFVFLLDNIYKTSEITVYINVMSDTRIPLPIFFYKYNRHKKTPLII